MEFIAYYNEDPDGWEVAPATPKRHWLNETPNAFAYRCLPLTMANHAGWVIPCPTTFWVEWNGSQDYRNSMRFGFEDGPNRHERRIASHFGCGILTFAPPYLFRTAPGIGLLVRGLPNHPKYNCTPLEGYVETDWLPFTFTMNWKIHKPKTPVVFTKGEPICYIQPFDLKVLEQSEPVLRPLSSNPELQAECAAWSKSRSEFNADPNRGTGWQKTYHKGPGDPAIKHRTSVSLKSFQKDDGSAAAKPPEEKAA